METALSPRQFAQAIGVSESSVRRWADDGQIKMTRTAGGHRRIPHAEAIRFVRDTSANVVRPDLLQLAEPGHRRGRPQAFAAQHEELLSALVAGNVDLVVGLLTGMYASGVSAAEMCDGPLRYAMQSIGEKWPSDKRGIFLEHRATSICIDALHRLRSRFRPPGTPSPLAIGGAPEKDPYVLPALMATTVLADLGFETVNLGPNTPLEVLTDSAVEMKADSVWIALTSPLPKAAVEQAVTKLSKRLRRPRVPIVLGGRSARRYTWPADQHLHVFDSMSEMAGFAKSLVATLRTQR